jgi:hypothetical protein
MIDCPHRSSPESDMATCGLAKNEVHVTLCAACQACGTPDLCEPNWFLASAVLMGYKQGKHNDHDAANVAQTAIIKAQAAASGVNFKQWLGNRRIRPLPRREEKTSKCIHLGREVNRQGCGCWRKGQYECKAQGGLVVIPETNCPCASYEEA